MMLGKSSRERAKRRNGGQKIAEPERAQRNERHAPERLGRIAG